MKHFKVAVIGGGVLGCAITYFLSSTLPQSSVVLIEQEPGVAYHASSRNTGKVHAPFYYDPVKKRLFARAAFLGFELWKEYAGKKQLPFKQDGVLEVATDQPRVQRLRKYIKWGEANGLQPEELQLLDQSQVRKREPNVRCEGALFCTRDASVDYSAFTRSLAQDSQSLGATFLLGGRVASITAGHSNVQLSLSNSQTVEAEFLVNAAGGSSLDVARLLGVGKDLSAVYFRGEYWKAPSQYRTLTHCSVYSVAKHPEYPFLDPHWILRANGEVEVGPNAVPVTGPAAYNWSSTMKRLPHFAYDLLQQGALRIFIDPEFLSLASAEWRSSLSKDAMIERVREFLPQVNPDAFQQRGFAGIRSVIVDGRGKFQDDAMILRTENSLHVLNYNSPGATGALPVGALLATQILELTASKLKKTRGLWSPEEISAKLSG